MLPIAALILIWLAIYGLIIAVLVWLIQRLGIRTRPAIFSSFVIFGLATGTLAALLWPQDSCVLANLFGVWLGDWIYLHAIEWLGNAHSAQAHETIPWLLRIPQSYVIASLGMCMVAGLVLQWTYSFRRHIVNSGREPSPPE